jgi:hypothetical protein
MPRMYMEGTGLSHVFENMELRRMFGPKTDEVTGGWRNLHNEQLHNFQSSPDIIMVNQIK